MAGERGDEAQAARTGEAEGAEQYGIAHVCYYDGARSARAVTPFACEESLLCCSDDRWPAV